MSLLVGAALAALLFYVVGWLIYRQSRGRIDKIEELDRAHGRFKTLFESADDGIILMHMERFIDCNRSALRLFGIPTVQAFVAGRFSRFLPTHQPDGSLSGVTFRAKLNDSLVRKPERFEWLFSSLDGKKFPAEVAIDVAHLGNENIIQLTIHDLSKRKQVENSARLANQAFENSLEGMIITDSNCDILTINKAFTAITGYRLDEVIGKNPRLLSSGRQTPEFYAQMWKSLKEHGRWQGEIWNRRKDQAIYPQWLNISWVLNEEREPVNYVGVFSDISERKSAEQRILRQGYYDQLTDLPNRTFFTERVNQLFALAWRNPATSLAVMFVDLDRLKVVNDSMGHEAGDQLLQLVAQRLTECVRKTDTVARISGDEFAILLSKISDPQNVTSIAEKLLQQFQQPFALNGVEIFISLSIGVSVFPGDGSNAEQMLQNANIAMNRVKRTGGARYELYDEDFGLRATQRMATETGLRKAVEHNEFELSYQPQFECDSGKMIGFEALLRWRHPELGLLFPDTFIGIAEETGLIVPIGEWVLQTACAQAQAWRQQSAQPRLIAVNLSARQFQHPGLVQQVMSALHDSGLPASCLELEITESILMKEIDVSVKVMHELAELGVQFSIDDFGTGYSSLAYLKKMPIQALKIDKSFIRDIVTNADDAAIVNAILAMSNQLGLRVVAEGIEEKEQLAHLRSCGGIVGQGYLLGRPTAAKEITLLIDKAASEPAFELVV